MERPVNLFKYLSLETARIVLASSRLRWSTPPLLNDPFDLGFDLHLDVDSGRVKAMALDLLWRDYLDDTRPPPSPGFAQWKTAALLTGLRLDRASFDAEIGPEIERRIRHPEALRRMNGDLRASLGRVKLLCLTERPDSILMWAHYGQQHFGAVLRFTLIGENNAFREARPVVYLAEMPRLADEEGLARMIAGRAEDPKVVTARQIYTKADVWAYEKEWRIQFGYGRDPDAPFEDLRFGEEQLTGLILGCRMPEADRTALTALARALNPEVEILVTRPAARAFRIDLETIDNPKPGLKGRGGTSAIDAAVADRRPIA